MDRLNGCSTLPRSNDNIKVKDEQLFKIKLALSSLTNSVIMCPMIANMYTQSPSDLETWNFFKRGVPCIIVNYDAHRVVVNIQLCLASPDSGFAIWRETILTTSEYKASQKNFHTFKLLSQQSGAGGGVCMAGIRFPQDDGANIFLHDVVNNIPKETYTTPVIKEAITQQKKSRSIWKGGGSIITTTKKRISKAEISRPCMYTHVAGSSLTGGTGAGDGLKCSKQQSGGGSHGNNKQSGSGSSIDHPDADPAQNTVARRSLHNI